MLASTGSRPARRRPGIGRLAAWLPVVALGAYAGLFLVRLGEITEVLYLNADVASGPVIAHLVSAAPSGREVVLGNYAWYEALAAQYLLDGLPARRFLLEHTPFALGVLTAAGAALSTRMATRSWWAFGIASTVVLASGPLVWSCLGTWTVHGLAWLHVAALGVFVVWVAGTTRRASALVVAVVLGCFTGVGAASDVLVLIAGIAPMIAATAGVAGRTNGRALSLPVAVCAVAAAASAAVALAFAGSLDIRGAGGVPIRAVSPGDLDANARVVAEALTEVVNGRFLHVEGGLSTHLHLAVAVLAAAAAALIVVELAARSRRLPARRPRETAHVTFWASSAASLVAASTLTTVPVDPTTGRYLIGVLLALAALLPLVGRSDGRRALLGLGVAFYAAVGVMSLARGEFTTNAARAPDAGTARALARVAAQEQVRIAYAGYWDAAPLTWSSEFALEVYPVRMCDETARLCPFEFHRISTWYRPRQDQRTMLVIDRSIRMLSVLAADPRLGPPTKLLSIGQLEVAIFDYDIARRFGPPAET